MVPPYFGHGTVWYGSPDSRRGPSAALQRAALRCNRYFAVADPAVDRVILRDVDSYVGQREADAVAEWVASGQPLHFMHDHAATMELQAGCVGFTRDFHPDILGLVMTFNHGLGELNQRGSFQQHVDQ